MASVRQRREIANYLNVAATGTEEYEFMGRGFVDLNDSPSAQTISKRYVNDASATQSIGSYQWTAPFTTDQIRSEKAVEFICNIGEKELTGAGAETDYVIAYLDKKIGTTGTEYEAKRRKIAVEVADFPPNDGELQASGNLLGIGDWTFGKFDTSTKAFTPET